MRLISEATEQGGVTCDLANKKNDTEDTIQALFSFEGYISFVKHFRCLCLFIQLRQIAIGN